jgi:hypothetical protein
MERVKHPHFVGQLSRRCHRIATEGFSDAVLMTARQPRSQSASQPANTGPEQPSTTSSKRAGPDPVSDQPFPVAYSVG